MQKLKQRPPFNPLGTSKVQLPAHPFRISICTANVDINDPAKVSVEDEVRILRSAMLYADHVSVCSISAYCMSELGTIQTTEDPFKFNHLFLCYLKGRLIEEVNHNRDTLAIQRDIEELEKREQQIRQVRASGSRSRMGELESFLRFKMEESQKRLPALFGPDIYQGLFVRSGLEDAISTGIVSIEKLASGGFYDTLALGWETFEQVSTVGYLSKLCEIAVNGKTHPLFDKITSRMIKEMARDGAIVIPPHTDKNAKECALAANLLERLPNFENATFDQILEIRESLKVPLKAFRSGMISFSEQIETASWDDSFEEEANRLFRKTIEPSILDLEARIKQDSYMQELLTLGDHPTKLMPGLAAVISPLFTLYEKMPEPTTVATGALSAATILTTGIYTYSKWRERLRENEKNQLLFYVTAGRMLAEKK